MSDQNEELTYEQLKKFKGFENLTDEELQEDVDSINTFCILAFELFKQIKNEPT